MALSEIYNDMLITFSYSSVIYLPSEIDSTVYTIDAVGDTALVPILIDELINL